MRLSTFPFALALGFALVVVGCSDDGSDSNDTNDTKSPVDVDCEDAKARFGECSIFNTIPASCGSQADETDRCASRCIAGLKATGRGPELVEQGLAICTGLVPYIGYDASAAIAKEAAKTGRTVREVARERTSLTADQLEAALDPFKMTEPGG